MKFCLWVTGLPGAGKSAVAEKLEMFLKQLGVEVIILQMDKIRKIITPEPTYSEEERDIVYGAIVYMAKLLVDTECKNVVIDATGNRKKYRDRARELILEFAEIYIKCPVEICQKRETSRVSQDVEADLYMKARSGGLKGKLPGVTAAYEASENPEVVLPSDELTPAESAEKIAEYIRSRWFNIRTNMAVE